MKRFKLLLCVLLFTCRLNNISAQAYLQFVENKGQWNQQIAFKGELTTGAFFLKPDGGYKMVLHNRTDLLSLLQSHHPNNNSQDIGQHKIGLLSQSTNTTKSNILHSHAYEVKFINANPSPKIIPEKPLEPCNNYFIGNNPVQWKSGCKIYQAVTYKNIYPNIDIRYYTSSSGHLKYDIIIHPGGNTQQIALYVDGAEDLQLKHGNLHIKTSVDDVQEQAPISYFLTDTHRQNVTCNYIVKGNIIRFSLSTDKPANATLVIDPTLIFSTFSGSKASNWGYTATYDNAGNFYAGGIVFGTGFPLSNGAFESFQGGVNYNGNSGGSGFDIGIIKFSPNGKNMVYATYLGGANGNEQPHSMIVDYAGNLVVSGRSSSTDYPIKPTTNAKLSGNGWDIIITKFNANATDIIGSIKIGGDGDDGVNIADKETFVANGLTQYSLRRNYGDDARSEVILDKQGNIYVASCSQSTNFPTINAAYSTNSGGEFGQDAILIKANFDLSNIFFSTYLGGSGDDAAFVLALNPINNNIYVAGATNSKDFRGNKSNSLYTTFQNGESDGFVAIFSNDGALQQMGYFGTSGTDLIYGIQFDKLGFPYIMGTTTGNWPIFNAKFSQQGGKQFISKLQPDLSSWIYSTTFGTNIAVPNISPTAFLVDRCENIYVSGWGGGGNFTRYPSGGTKGLTTTGNPYKANSYGNDFYFFVLEKNAQSQLYGDFFGQDPPQGWANHVDGGTSRFDKNGIIYQTFCANCFGNGSIGNGNFPIYPPGGVWSSINGTTQPSGIVLGCNIAAIKIAFNLAGVAGGIEAALNGKLKDTVGCVPAIANFTDTVGMAKSYIWDYGDGSPQLSTKNKSVAHNYNSVGFYKVMMIAVDSNSCNIYDTSYVTVRIKTDKVDLALASTKIGGCQSLTYQFSNNSTTTSTKPFQVNSFKIDYGDGSPIAFIGSGTIMPNHTFPATGTYNIKLVLVDTNFCNQGDSIFFSLRIASNLKAQFTTPAIGCVPYSANFTNTSTGGTNFIWDFGDNTGSTTDNPTPHLYADTGTYTIQLKAFDNTTCNKEDSFTTTIHVYPKPMAGFTATPQPPQNNTPITFTNTSTGAAKYEWRFGDADTLITNSINPVNHIYPASQTYYPCLLVTSSYGCIDTLCKSIQALITPLFDVPNAFTPNGDGINDKIFVRGYGIAKMNWEIYNRWGNKVFESTNQLNGWDGTLKGVLQPQDVYHYTLNIEMTNGKKYIKKGDITLLR